MKLSLASLAGIVVLSSASPVTPVPRGGIPSLKQLQCVLISDVSSVLGKVNNGGASAFCSSYIASTTTSTKTFSTTSVTTSTNVVPLTATTTTVTTAPTPTSTSYVYSDCAQPGYDKGTAAYHFDGSGAYGTFATCSGLCSADANCVSFAVGSGDCLLYNITVASNINPVATSPFLFYDRNCPASSAPADAATTNGTTVAPTKRELLPRAGVPTPPPFGGLQPARISSVCSCVISTPSTITSVVSTTKTILSTVVVATSVTVATDTITSTVTPAPTTVTVTTSVA